MQARRTADGTFSQLVRASLLVFSVFTGLARAQDSSESDARQLEQRLHAPCCRHQLLDGHESEIARGVRQEIRTRLRGGETPAAIESDFVRRYGASIVSIPVDRDPRNALSLLLLVTMSLAALGLSLLGLRWVRRSRALAGTLATPADSAPVDELDARLDRELSRLDS